MKKNKWKLKAQCLRVLIPFVILLALGLLKAPPTWPQDTTIPAKTIQVVLDYDYPPYIYLDSEGHPRGILPDLWHLWEEKTGIHVQLSAMHWAEAQRRMQAGEYDVIDTIFQTAEREKIYAFSKPYAKIDVPIFYRSDISGIRNVQDLKGFMVAVKTGDSDIDVLLSHGITSLSYFNSYEQIIAAARDHKVNVFVVDKPPAYYYLYKFGINEQFRETAPLYSGEFHRAVLRGNDALLRTVEDGFALISQIEHEKIFQRWYGKPLFSNSVLRLFLIAALLTGIVLLFLFLWIWILRRLVQKKTSALLNEINLRIEQEKILRESEKKFRMVFDHANDAIYVINTQGRLLEANPVACERLGYTRSEMMSLALGQIVNAVQAMPRGGTITISATNVYLVEENSLSLPAGDYVRLTLADQGCGILQEDLEKVFDPYFTTKMDGNGLGLSSVYSIIKKHKGHISVVSTVGRGTIFTLHLSANGKVDEKQASEELAMEQVAFQGGPVLVMDDDEVIREITINMLAHLGFKVTACFSGEEAVALYDSSAAEGNPFLFVILDLTVPGGFGGKETAEKILSLYPDANLVVSSGYSNDPVMARFREYGFKGAIAKPYDIKKFQELLKILIG